MMLYSFLEKCSDLRVIFARALSAREISYSKWSSKNDASLRPRILEIRKCKIT